MYLEMKDIYFQYKNSKEPVLKNFHIEIEQGEIVSILGESGSGKSTILRVISGLEVSNRGSVKINGKIMNDSKTFIPPQKRGIGMVFQDYALFPHMRVDKNIEFGLKNIKREEKERRINDILDLVNLTDLSMRYPHELSGGQQQRVALARALAPRPSLLLLDEPFSNLDANLKGKIREELKKIIHKAKSTTIFVTHDQEDALCLADKVVIVEKGKVMKMGKTKDILRKK